MLNYIRQTYWAYRNKITNKLWGVVHVPAKERTAGKVLISYITEPFTLAPWEHFSTLHSSYQECRIIAELFAKHGYDVDGINSINTIFQPLKKYRYILDIGANIDRLSDLMPHTKKIFYIVESHNSFHNKAEQKRIKELESRRGITLARRRVTKSHESPEKADFLVGLGNTQTHNTYAHIGKPIFPIPISTTVTFPSPESKSFDKVHTTFLWLGGGGMIHKGLDLVLEVFKKKPEWTLHICGPVEAEEDFVNLYREELYDTENIHLHGRIHPDGGLFKEIADSSIALIYPSSSEGQAGSVVTAMHAGLIPVISKYSGVDTGDFGLTLKECTMEEIEASLSKISNLPTDTLKEMSIGAWKYSNTHHTKESFSRAFEEFLTNVVKI